MESKDGGKGGARAAENGVTEGSSGASEERIDLGVDTVVRSQDAETALAVRGEVRDYVESHEQRRRQLPRAILVGLLAGLTGTAFRWSLVLLEAMRTRLIVHLHTESRWGFLAPMLIAGIGSGIAVYMVQVGAPEASGSGIPHIKAVLHQLRRMRWKRILPVKFFGGAIGIGAGLALGREGPTIQMGGALGQMVAEWLGATSRERQSLIAAGAGAGLAAAFNAPLAGMVFVLEEVQRDFTPSVFGAALVASVTSDFVSRWLIGQNPVFKLPVYPPAPLATIPAYVVLGVLAGVFGVLYNRGLLAGLNLFGRLGKWKPGMAGVVVGLCLGLVGWFYPDVIGGGYPIMDQIFAGHMLLKLVPLYFILRFGLTMFSYGCGAPGGIFAPLLVLGAMIGLVVGQGAHFLLHGMAPYPEAFAVVGMAAYFSAIVRAPLTGIVLIVEMTGSYNQMLPLLIACLIAYGVADSLRDQPIYEALLERDLLRGQHKPELEDTFLLEVVIQHAAPFEGTMVRSLGLPPGCILITVNRQLRDMVPHGDTILRAGDRLTAVIEPEAVAAVQLIREGAAPPSEHETAHGSEPGSDHGSEPVPEHAPKHTTEPLSGRAAEYEEPE